MGGSPVLCFLEAGIGLQMLHSEIRVDFMCVAIGNLLLYNYCGNIVNHIDMTTQLLIGYAFFDKTKTDIQTVIDEADEKMYQNKHTNTFV